MHKSSIGFSLSELTSENPGIKADTHSLSQIPSRLTEQRKDVL